MKDTKDSELLHFSSLNFVIFATFVVNVLFLFWLRLRRARFSAVGRRHFSKDPAIVSPETMRSPNLKIILAMSEDNPGSSLPRCGSRYRPVIRS